MAEARLQREAFESLDKAWNARTVTNDRIKSLIRDVEAGRKVIAAYSKEYELGQRSLLDLLTAESQYFNSSVSLVSARGVAVFADYQLLAVMGKLLTYLKEPHPADAEPLDVAGLHIFQFVLPPVIIQEPDAGPKPLKFIPYELEAPLGRRADAAPGQKSIASNFDQRWDAARQSSPSTLPDLFRYWFAEHQKPGTAVAGLGLGEKQGLPRIFVLSYAQ
jgi:adhesin transport system outer membrane protein